MWTRFWDMHSGGGQKEKWSKIYIEADSQEEAEVIFYNRFGHSPNRITCTCCGEDYSVDSGKDLGQITGYDRGCRNIFKKVNGKYTNQKYIEASARVPKGYKTDSLSSFNKYQSLKQYMKNQDVLFISKKDVKEDEKHGELPLQGYVWVN